MLYVGMVYVLCVVNRLPYFPKRHPTVKFTEVIPAGIGEDMTLIPIILYNKIDTMKKTNKVIRFYYFSVLRQPNWLANSTKKDELVVRHLRF